MSEPLLSICICTLHKRIGLLAILMRNLSEQAERFPGQVEFVVIDDNGERPTGTKRNAAYKQARGKYVASVDDDDEVSPWYIEEILKAAEQDPDAIAMNGTMTTDGGPADTWDISRNNPYATLSKGGKRRHYVRYHNHLSPIRRTIALQFPFPDVSEREDYAFATTLHKAKAIKTEVKISKPMYHYKYVSQK
jgi:glycosyltransferase involved in cell wall biosynthesis